MHASVVSAEMPKRLSHSEHLASDGDIAAVFASYDKDGNGSLCEAEMLSAMKSLKMPLSKKELHDLHQQLDSNKDGTVSLQEFMQFYRRRELELVEVFGHLCDNESAGGRLTEDSLCAGLSALDIKATNDELQRFVRLLDADRDGSVDFHEFRAALTLLPITHPRAVFDMFRREAIVEYAQSEYTRPPDLACSLGAGLPPAVVQLVSGAVAGTVSRTGTAPIDRLKTLMQAGGSRVPSGLMDGMRMIYGEGGARAFFQGNGANCVKVAPETAIKMGAFDTLKPLLASDPAAVTTLERFVAGGLAGALAQGTIYPLETVKTRLALAQPGQYSGVVGCLQTVCRQEGVKALYRGLGVSLVGIVPYAGIDLMINSVLRDWAGAFYSARGAEPGVGTLLAAGMASSTCAMSLTYPIGFVRTRLQAPPVPGSVPYSSPLDVARRVVQTEGALGLFRGFVPNLLKVVPAAALSYSVYGTMTKALQGR